MDSERKIVKLLMNEEKLVFTDLVLYEEAIDDEDMVLLEIIVDGQKVSYKSENFFSALINLRKELEKKNIQIICNGAAKNIYPSPMQMSMGSGRTAYKLCMGKQARNSDVVDIFDCDEDLEFANIEEQSKYYAEWLKSIMG
ncbi:MAG: hypothetical protein ACRC7N_01620 [Clostridium sp.]